MGGEWASGAALVSETWKARDRGKALGLMQSSWAIGYGLAALVNYLVQDVLGYGWRTVFFVGVVPALFAFWVRTRRRRAGDVASRARESLDDVALESTRGAR